MRVTWKKPWRVVCSYVVLCYVCCCGCYASQERVNTSAVPMAPCIFFHPPSSCLAYHRFSKQCTQWDTTGQLVLGAASTIYCIIEWWFILTLCVNWFSHWGEIYQCFILIMEYVRIKEQANHAWFRAFCTNDLTCLLEGYVSLRWVPWTSMGTLGKERYHQRAPQLDP